MLSSDTFPPRFAELGFRAASFDRKKSRLPWLRDPVDVILPPMCQVPEGGFYMGSDPKRDGFAPEDEQPQRWVTLSAFEIARYPLTVAEYNCYLRAQGKPLDTGPFARIDRPIIDITHDNAVSYCLWLSELTGLRWSLPSEIQWEKAARGADGRTYPWGDVFDGSRCNFSDHHDTTSPIGRYPTGTSPYGVEDMAGNVWEWTSTVYDGDLSVNRLGSKDVDTAEHYVIRGGSWVSEKRDVRSACRKHLHHGFLYQYVGVRLTCGSL